MDWQVAVIGGGIAGLYAALNLSTKKHSVVLIDERDYVGGRILTNADPRYEIGAGRFHNNQRLVNELVTRYTLRKIELSSITRYMDACTATYIKHYWSEGCHYWRPGFDSDRVSKDMINPLPGVFICGEGFSQDQCWMEGALQTSEEVVSRILETSKKK